MRIEILKTPDSWLLGTGSCFVAFFLLLSACSGLQVQQGMSNNTIPSEIREDLTVSGTIRVKGEVKVFPKATLTVKPGTHFFFEPFDPDGDGVNDSRLLIEGRLVARGEPDAPIIFTSAAENPEPGDWLELRIERSEGIVFEYSVLEHSRYGLHVHFSSGVVANSIFRNNIDGTRFGTSHFMFLGNRISGNIGKGVNLRDSKIWVAGNSFINNRHGVFIFEKGAESSIWNNRFTDNTSSDIRFGDFYEGDSPDLYSNEGSDNGTLRIPGMQQLAEGGSGRPSVAVGPQVYSWQITPLWEQEVGSFVDGSPVALSGKRVAVASWEEGISILRMEDGELVTSIQVGDFVNATPLFDGAALFLPVWNRTFVRIDPESGSIVQKIEWSESLADDHRQASPVQLDGSIVQGLWNGELWALNPWSLEKNWNLKLDGPIRGTPSVDTGKIWVVTEVGTIYLISDKGIIMKELSVEEPVWASPAYLGDGRLAVVTKRGILKAFNWDGLVWSRKLTGPGTYAPPVALGSWTFATVAVADGNGSVSMFDSDGALLWRTETGSAVHTLSRRGRALWVGTEDGTLSALSFSTGKVRVKLRAGGAVHGAPVWTGMWDPVVWASRDGVVRAHNLTVDQHPWEGPLQ